jgi:NAD(P)H-hydrate epimerase
VNRGREVRVVLAREPLGPAAAHHLATLDEMGVDMGADPGDAPVIVDALVGYGLSGPLRGRAAELVKAVSGRFVVSLDFPSGYGEVGGLIPAVTLTLALPKQALRGVRPLYLADLGLPPALWTRMDLAVPALFGRTRILEITP